MKSSYYRCLCGRSTDFDWKFEAGAGDTGGSHWLTAYCLRGCLRVSSKRVVSRCLDARLSSDCINQVELEWQLRTSAGYIGRYV